MDRTSRSPAGARRLAGVRVALVVTALTAVLGACGGGVTKASFLAKADGACGTGNGAAAAVAQPSSLPELGVAAGTLATTVDDQVAALRKLKPPDDDKRQVEGVLGALAGTAAPARALQNAAGKTDDGATARAANDLRTAVDAAAVQAKAYGLTACGPGLQGPATKVVDGARSVIKAVFVARAESLCAAANRKVGALPDPTSLASEARFLATYMPIEEKLFADIKALVRPPGDEAALADMLAAQDQVIAKDKETLAAAQKGNAALVDRLDGENATLITAANSRFDAYGLRSCGTLSLF